MQLEIRFMLSWKHANLPKFKLDPLTSALFNFSE